MDLNFATLTSVTSLYDNDGSSETDNTGFYANNFADLYTNILLRTLSCIHWRKYECSLFIHLYHCILLIEYFDKALIQELRLVGSINNQILKAMSLVFFIETMTAALHK